MNIKTVSRNTGFALLVSALFMLLSIIVSVANGNDSALAALIISFTITFIVGVFPLIFVRKSKVITLLDGYMIIAISWFLSFIFGMLPYLLWGGPFSVANAFFESVSGFTTTGSTILDDVEALPKSLLFWRSSTHFIGGLGVVVFLLIILPSGSPMRLRLTNLELSALSKNTYGSRANKTVFIFTYVYLGLIAAAFICYLLAGMSAFDAINHAFSVVSTGGFSTRNASIAWYDSQAVNIISIVFMFLSSIHFGLIYMTLATRSLKPLRNPILRAYICTLVAATLIVAALFRIHNVFDSVGESLMQGAFHVFSYMSSTGFSIADSAVFPQAAMVVLTLICLSCGMSGSTTGGARIDRFILFSKSASRQIRLSLHPSDVREVRIGGNIIHDDAVQPQVLYIGIYAGLLMFSTLALMVSGLSSSQSIYASISSVGNVGFFGLGSGEFPSYNAMPSLAKVICSLDMFLGRVEIYPVFALIASAFDRK